MSTNKTFNKVQLDVKFTQATTRANLISEENISISFGKISKYFADLHSQAFTGYTHPNSFTAKTTAGFYKYTVNTNGHVTAGAALAKSDITALGIPGQDTTYSAGNHLSLSSTTFSLASYCKSITDWNSATTNGWYMGSSVTNAPSTEWWMGRVIAHNNKYCIQEVWNFSVSAPDNANPDAMYMSHKKRWFRAEHWGPWVDVSTPTPSAKVNCEFGTVASRTTNVTRGWMAYWDGSYNGSSSNLTYCNRGAFGTIVTKNTGDYVPNTQAGVNAAINLLSTGSSTPSLADYYVSQYANGGTTTTSYHRRPISALWDAFKGLITLTTTGSGNAVTAVSIANDGDNNRKITVTKGSTFSLDGHDNKCTVTNGSTTSTNYGIVFAANPNTTENNTLRKTNDFRYQMKDGAANTEGFASIVLGNTKKLSEANNKSGNIYLYSSGGYWHLINTTSTASNITHTLPATSGTILNSGTTSFTQTLSSGTKIGTIKINGTSTDLYCQTNTNTTYTVATGDSNGQIKVTPSGGTAYNVSVKGLGTAAYKASSAFAVSETLANDTNLNNITTPGFYNCGGTNSVTNKPSNVDAFGLNVIHDASGQWYTQILYPNNASPLIYVRNYNGSAWSGWNSIAIGSFLPLSGGTMTGTLTAKASQYADEYGGALNMNNSNIYGVNAIYTADVSDNAAEGIHFYRDSTHVDTLWMNGGSLLFVPNRELGTSTTAANSQKVARFTATPTSGQVVITDGTTGGIKSSGYTIAKSVPSNAVFTDHITTVTSSGSGNAVTAISADANGALTVTKGSTFSLSTHTHGLLHSDLTQVASKGTTGGWSVIGIDPTVNGYVLKSIRINETSPNWLSGSYGAGIAFGGYDTKGVISMRWDSPVITFAGGNHKSTVTSPKWYFKISGTSGSTYDLANFNAATATTASKLSNTSAIGSSTQPVYFNENGVPVACTQDANKAHFSTVPFVRNDGVMEVGRYFDMHSTNTGTTDYDVRLDASGVSSFRFTFNTPASSSIAPSTNNQTSLGTSSLKWSNVYATTFYGALSGNASTATRANYVNVVAGNEIRFYNDNQFTANKHFWLGYSWADGSHYTPSGGSDTSSTTAPNITKFIMGNCSQGGLASVHAKTFILGNGSSPTHTSKTTTIATAATTTDRTITLPNASGTVALLTKGSTSFWGLIDGDASTSNWIRATSNGFIPSAEARFFQTATSSLGTNTWYFKHSYIQNMTANRLVLGAAKTADGAAKGQVKFFSGNASDATGTVTLECANDSAHTGDYTVKLPTWNGTIPIFEKLFEGASNTVSLSYSDINEYDVFLITVANSNATSEQVTVTSLWISNVAGVHDMPLIWGGAPTSSGGSCNVTSGWIQLSKNSGKTTFVVAHKPSVAQMTSSGWTISSPTYNLYIRKIFGLKAFKRT